MADRWMIEGVQYTNCNCDAGCPCQFGSNTTYGHCEAVIAGTVKEGYFNDTRLENLSYALLVHWPGEIAAGDGTEQVIIDERADEAQREALRKIVYGESTKPGATHFFVFNSTMSKVLDPIYASVDLSIDVEGRKADLKVDGIVESTGRPIVSTFTGELVRSGIHLPAGFEYTYAEVGKGTTKGVGDVKLDFSESHGHFNVLHMNQDGVIR